jgi:uncharacterized protein YodC (DUF2158 family)
VIVQKVIRETLRMKRMKLRNSSSAAATEREKFIMHLARIKQSAMEDFEIGNVVQLRSGGPKMTVHGLVSDGDVICQWFEGNAVHEESFPREALQKVELVKAGGSRREDGVFVVS